MDGRRYWRVPVMEGEFLVEEAFGTQKAIGGGNLLILAKDQAAALAAAEASVDAMRQVRGVILPFPGGIVRAGSKVGAKRYKNMTASTNEAYCPTVRGRLGVASELPETVNSVLEIVIDGLDRAAIEDAMRARPRRRVPAGGRPDLGGQLRRQAREASVQAARLTQLTPMRIFVYEFVTGGGLAGRPVPRSLAREGLAMRSALLEDLAAIDGHEIVMTTDTRFTRRMPPGVDSVPVAGGLQASGASGASETIDALIDASDAVWLIAPETGRCLERLAARVERRGKTLLGSGAAAVRMAADKSRLPRRLARTCIGHPEDDCPCAGCECANCGTPHRLSGGRQAVERRGVSGCTVSAARAGFGSGD